jgi:hypothetical protein
MENFLWLSLEKLTSKGIISVFVLIIKLWHRLEYHIISRTTPVEFLLGEFKSIVIANSHGDVVISFDTADSTPKE